MISSGLTPTYSLVCFISYLKVAVISSKSPKWQDLASGFYARHIMYSQFLLSSLQMKLLQRDSPVQANFSRSIQSQYMFLFLKITFQFSSSSNVRVMRLFFPVKFCFWLNLRIFEKEGMSLRGSKVPSALRESAMASSQIPAFFFSFRPNSTYSLKKNPTSTMEKQSQTSSFPKQQTLLQAFTKLRRSEDQKSFTFNFKLLLRESLRELYILRLGKCSCINQTLVE